MAKRENDLSERTLAEKVDGVGDTFTRGDLGKRSPIKRAVRKKPAANAAPDPMEAMKAMFLANVNTDLRARNAKGQRLPTLQDRIQREGYTSQFKKKPPVKPSGKKRKKTKVKRAKRS